MLFISDIHGCFVTLTKLLSQFPGEQVYFLGDLIDRGPDSAAVVRYAMENKILTLMGNHEHLCLHHHGIGARDDYAHGTWLRNGGGGCLESFGLHHHTDRLPDDVLEWMRHLPRAFAMVDDDVLLSHTGHGLDSDEFTALWSRTMKFPDDGYLRVLGHTPNKTPVKGDNWVNIDTGCAYGGGLTALQWPSGRLVTIPNCEPKILT